MPAWRIASCEASPSTSITFDVINYYYSYGRLRMPGAEVSHQFKAPFNMTLSKLFVRVTTNSLNGNCIVITRKNGVDGNQSVTIPAFATGAFEDNVQSDNFVNGDFYCYEADTWAASTGNIWFSIMSCVMEAISGTIIGGTQEGGYREDRTYYNPIIGFLSAGLVSDAAVCYRFRTATTLSNLRIYVESNLKATATTFRLRKNGVDGNQSIIVLAGASGEFEDAVNTDNVAVGESVNYRVPSSGAATTRIYPTVVQLKSTSTQRQTGTGDSSSTVIPTGTNFQAIEGPSQLSNTVESATQLTVRINDTFRNLFVNLPTNTRNGVSTVRTRKSTADGNLSVDIPAGTAGEFEDNISSDNVIPTDVYNFQIVVGGAAGSFIPNVIGVEQQGYALVGAESKSGGIAQKLAVAGVI